MLQLVGSGWWVQGGGYGALPEAGPSRVGVGFVGDDTHRSCHCVSISAIPGMPAVDIEASNRYVKRAGESFCLWVVGAPYIQNCMC